MLIEKEKTALSLDVTDRILEYKGGFGLHASCVPSNFFLGIMNENPN